METDFAFPHSRLGSDCDGITMHQYFAAKAMHALLMTEYKGRKAVYDGWDDALAHEAFLIAKAMMRKSIVAPPKDSTNHIAEPIGWLEAPHGTFKRNHSVSVNFPPQTVDWKIPVFLGTPARAEEEGT